MHNMSVAVATAFAVSNVSMIQVHNIENLR